MVFFKEAVLKISKIHRKQTDEMGYSRKNPNREVEDILFWKAPLEFSEKPLFYFIQGQKERPLEIPHHFFLDTFWNFSSFLINPWKFHMLFLWYPEKFHILNPPPPTPHPTPYSLPPVWISSRIGHYKTNFQNNCLRWSLHQFCGL